MLVDVGTHFDLSHINKKTVDTQKKTTLADHVREPVEKTMGRLVPVGTQFIRNKITGSWDVRIPVSFA